jgi:hypothetical protein
MVNKKDSENFEPQRNAVNDAVLSSQSFSSESFDTEAGAELGGVNAANQANAMQAASASLNTEAGEEFGELNLSDKAKSQMSHNAVDAEAKDKNDL